MSEKRIRVVICSGDIAGSNYYRAGLVKRGLDRIADEVEIDCVYTDRWLRSAAPVDVLYLVHPNHKTISVDTLHHLKRLGVAIVVDGDDAIWDVPKESNAWAASQDSAFRQYRRAIHATADMITGPTKRACEYFAERTGNWRALRRAIPNAMDEALRLSRPAGGIGDGDTPVVGFVGGNQHHGDFAPLEPLWDAIFAKGWALHFCGTLPHALKGEGWKATGNRVAFVEGTPEIEQYFQLVPLLPIDVGIAPLVDDTFNRVKSPLKACNEYGYLLGCPAVLSDVEAFAEVDDPLCAKVAGFEVDAWMAALEAAVEKARPGRQYRLAERYRLNTTARQWAAAFREAYEAVQGGL